VASDIVGSAFELVRSGENGYVFPSGDGRALQEALLRVTDPARIDGFKAGSRALSVAWRRASDPVEGFRAALGSVGLL
jgi:glycosyltransferase involved in cell wall biosynthesis